MPLAWRPMSRLCANAGTYDLVRWRAPGLPRTRTAAQSRRSCSSTWGSGRIELDGALSEVRHRQVLRAGFDIVSQGTTLFSIRPRRGLRVMATLKLPAYVPPVPRL